MTARVLAALAVATALALLAPGLPEPASGPQSTPAGATADPGPRPFELDRVSYRLQPSERPPADAVSGGHVQRAVNYAFSQVLPDDRVAFALESAQSSRIDGGGHHFEGDGIATWRDGGARFVSFTMTLSARGELVEFDYSATPDPWGDANPSLVAEN